MSGQKDDESKLSQKAVFRVGLLLATILIFFAIAKQLVVPDSFGQYGNYRGDDLGEWASLEAKFADGNEVCSKCHQAKFETISQGKHQALDCQSCHGPAARHVKNPVEWSPRISGSEEICAACHKEVTARSKDEVPTVNIGIHSGGMNCSRCHQTH